MPKHAFAGNIRQWGDQDNCVTIQLRADHPHYRQPVQEKSYITGLKGMSFRPMDTQAAFERGMKPWDGGDAAPDDWDGKEVLTRSGEMVDPKDARDAFTWGHASPDDKLRMPHFDIVAYNPKPAPIDWSGELEAVHEDGRVVPARYDGVPKRFNGHKVSYDDGEGEWSWCVFEDGRTMIDQSWRIRNVIPQPTPQADTKPDVTVRAPCMTISEVREMVAKGEGAVIATMLERGYALPEPVDEDLIEARKLAHEFVGDRAGWQGILEGKHDSSPAITQLITAIKRGRELALAGKTGK